MATYQTYTAIGQREDLSDVIYDIQPNRHSPDVVYRQGQSNCYLP